MSSAFEKTVAASLAVSALLAAGCQRGGNTSPTGPSDRNSAPVSTVTADIPKNLVTPETAGKPVLLLKLGEPVAFRKGGITLTFNAKSFEKLDSEPPDLTESSRKESCGVWWKLSAEIVVDAEPNATWKTWAMDSLGAFIGFQKGKEDGKYEDIVLTDKGTGTDQISKQTLPAEKERRANPSVPFHKTLEMKEYYGMCGLDSQYHPTGKPSGLDPLGVDLLLENIRDGEIDTLIARWLL